MHYTAESFGLGYDSNDPNTAKARRPIFLWRFTYHRIAIIDWTLLTAGSVYNASVSSATDTLITKVEARPYFKNPQNKPNPSTYAADQGTTISGLSSPALGASFALLTLKWVCSICKTKDVDGLIHGSVPDQSSITLPNGTVINSSSGSRTTERNDILGGTLGAVAGLTLVGLIFFFLRRRQSEQRGREEFEKSLQSPSLIASSPLDAATVTPFSMDSNKARLTKMYDEGAPSTVPTSSDSGSRASEPSAPLNSNQEQKQMRLVPQRPTHLHVTNITPGGEKPLPSPTTPRLQPEGSRTGEDQSLRQEVEQLRMEMDAMRAVQRRSRVTEEPPPGYAES